MRFVRSALVAALAVLVLFVAVSAQTLRSQGDPRNTSPTVGTGGPVGGPTGLFTIYDDQTLRRGEYTFSIAYSNYDRDPGNADIVEVPVSFQIGVNDYMELFFNTDAYRGVKVNAPTNLSGFFLPNSLLNYGGVLRNGAAIVQAPQGPGVSRFPGSAIFRPFGTAPFVQFPYVGGSAGGFGGTPTSMGVVFGFPTGTVPLIGAPVVVGSASNGNYGGAANFPGLGSPFGSILPGVVFSTVPLSFPTNCNPQPCTAPVAFTVAPTYLPDAPFINRVYGQSAFSTFTVGTKIRFNDVNSSFGWGVVGFYRFYADKADDAGGFNQLQRGASPGGGIGDFGAVLFASARLSRSVQVSGNFGYVLNSNPKGQFPSGSFTLLDRPDEVLAGLGFDFPVNKYFQPMIEVRSTTYAGSRTPNALENSPVDVIAGFKLYPRRWFGLGAAWRYHVNQQDRASFGGDNGAQNVIIPGATTVAPLFTDGAPAGFVPSDDANGFIVQAWIGRRNERKPDVLPNQAPTVSLGSNTTVITLPCPTGYSAPAGSACPATQTVQLAADAKDPDGDTLLYTYSVTGGRIVGEGANVSWDLTGLQPGSYSTTVEVDDGCGCVTFDTKTVEVKACPSCVPDTVCPVVRIDCPTDVVQAGTPAAIVANVSGGTGYNNITYNWSISGGTITSGQGTPSITVDTTGLGQSSVTATVEIGGVGPECQKTASCTFSVGGIPTARKFDEYSNLKRNDEKARWDNFAIELQNNPTAQGYIIAYGGRTSTAGEAQDHLNKAKEYLVNTRNIDAGRIVTVDGGYTENWTVEMWIVPQGATPPTAKPTVDASEVKMKGGRRAGRRH